MTRPTRIPEAFPLVQDPPFSLDGTRTLMLALPADHARLAAMCARTFGWAAPDVVVEPAGSIVLLVLTDVAAARAADPALGTFAYREATFFVPVKGTRGGAPFRAMHVPFIYPSAGLAVAAGREIYGLPKKPAEVVFPPDAELWAGTGAISVRALAAQAFDGSAWQERALLGVTSQPQGLAVTLADALLDALDALLGPFVLPPRFLQQDLLQLKQVPDVTTGGVPARVLHRSIVKLTAPVRTLTGVRLADPTKVKVTLADLASEPIRTVLGLPAIVTPLVAASLTMDFRFEPGEIWLEKNDAVVALPPKKKVLVLGGGVSGLATAHALTDTDARRQAYDVRVLSEGHFLGGKGGNVRNPGKAQRIEEHGLHVIFGFYHNFLRLFRSVYAEANRPASTEPTTFDEAFKPNYRVTFHDGSDGWEVVFPKLPPTYGAGPMPLEQQLLAAGALVQTIAGASFGGMLSGAIFPGLGGNPVAAQVLKFTLTLLKGVFTDVVVKQKSWDELDEEDFRAWMMSHALPGFGDIEHSAIMQVPYDGVFAYEGPDQSQPVLNAGAAARGLLKLVTDYEKAPYWLMTTGMGEAVVMPLFEVLRARGVAIEPFSRVKEIRTVGGRVTEVVVARQARVLAGPAAYDPVTTVGSIRCWRDRPDAAQLDPASPALVEDPMSDASTMQIGPDVVLSEGVDFDWVVCALPAPVTASVLRGHAAHPVLSKIVQIPTVATLHLQLWTRDAIDALGWSWTARVLGGFRQPLNSMLESSHILDAEGWLPGSGPRGLLYASGPFGGGWSTDSTSPAARAAAATAARTEATTFTEHELVKVLPGAATGAGTLDLAILHAPFTGNPMDDQYVRGNVDRSSRYVLMKPGTQRFRPRPDDGSLVNLRFVGDWTRNGIDVPCMEGTVTSALQAAESILGETLNILW